MRKTALPLLRDLNSGVIISRCAFCGSFVLAEEECRSASERDGCVPRGFLEGSEHVPVAVIFAGEVRP